MATTTTKHGPLRLHAKTPVPLQVEVELDPSETKGAVQAFDVIQTGASGQVQGGLRLLAVVPHENRITPARDPGHQVNLALPCPWICRARRPRSKGGPGLNEFVAQGEFDQC